jgi:hypothetical protein
MKIAFHYALRIVCSLLLIWVLIAQSAIAQDHQDHVVTWSDIQKDVAASSALREKYRAELEDSISSPNAQKALKTAHLDLVQVKTAISKLDDSELAQLSTRSGQARKDFIAGRISDRDLIIILIAIVALILIIVAVR